MTTSTTVTFTEAYLQEVSRRLPPRSRADVVRELRGTLADTVDDRVARGLPPEQAEREALEELGDPARLAEDYSPGPHHLIGPTHYHDFLGLLRLLAPVLAVVLGTLTLLRRLFGEAGQQDPATYLALSLGPALGAALEGALVGAGIAVAVYAVLERAEAAREAGRVSDAVAPGPVGARGWTVEQLPPPGSEREFTAGELAGSSVVLVLAAAAPFLLSQPVVAAGPVGGQPLLDPALWSPWVVLYLGLVVLAWGWELVRFARRRWSWPLFAANAVLDLAMAGLLITVLCTESVVNPVFRELDWVDERFAQAGVALVVVVTVWDLVATFMACRRSTTRG